MDNCGSAIRATIVLTLVTALLHGAPPRAPARNKSPETVTQPTWTAAIARMKRSIVPIVCMSADHSGGGARVNLVDGTGFILSAQGRFITAGHVITDFLEKRISCDFAAIYLARNGWPDNGVLLIQNLTWFKFLPSNCRLDRVSDLADCRTIDNLATKEGIHIEPVRFGPDLVPEGTDIAFSGFPLKLPVPRTARASVSGYGADQGITNELAIDANAWPGVSGAPVYLLDGTTIGMVLSRGTQDAAGLTFARPVRKIREFLAAGRGNSDGGAE